MMKAKLCAIKARLWVFENSWDKGWCWELKVFSNTPATICGDDVYSTESSAKRAARRWAKAHNVEIERTK
jgi:hypothetical protein